MTRVTKAEEGEEKGQCILYFCFYMFQSFVSLAPSAKWKGFWWRFAHAPLDQTFRKTPLFLLLLLFIIHNCKKGHFERMCTHGPKEMLWNILENPSSMAKSSVSYFSELQVKNPSFDIAMSEVFSLFLSWKTQNFSLFLNHLFHGYQKASPFFSNFPFNPLFLCIFHTHQQLPPQLWFKRQHFIL